ncbi:helix-turn-helix transcriptional regulator [Leptolyngbya sp. FACHB-541]|uniref:helix-turn-helix domain-containing protein n=1 Tax=Leptolyngbya sp. FACHB-541 TaxID=2692810 RepID=UPI0016897E02|nr:helix-turn-helix transcriptional regulator [Leptolyngbya sp. FACHB-541]MBD1996223.1 helix-turn-helix transcriptional regulator [Leptolyngbya sp. FACHB-541]
MPAKPSQAKRNRRPMDLEGASVYGNVEVVDPAEIEASRQREEISHQPDKAMFPAVQASAQRPAPSPALFSSGDTDYAASSRVIWEGANILTQGSDLPWLVSDEGEAYYKSLVGKGKGYISFWLTDDLYAKDPSVLERDFAIALIEQFDLRAACLHLIYAAHATQLDRPWEESFTINDIQLEQYLGLNKNKKLNKQQKLQLMLKLAKQPCHLLVYISWPEQGRVPTVSVSRTWLWEIAEPILHFQECLTDEAGHGVGDKTLVGFTLNIRCGMWAKYFLNEEMRRQKQGYYEYCILSKELIQDIMSTYHHYEGAARLMTWLLFKTKINRSSPLTAELLLRIAFGEKALQEALASSKHRAKLVESWIKTLKALLERGWTITPDPQTYPLSYWVDSGETGSLRDVPDDPDAAVEFWAQDAGAAAGSRVTDRTRRERGSFTRFLSGRLWIQPPKVIADRLDAIDEIRWGYNKASAAKQPVPTDLASTTSTAVATRQIREIQSGEHLKQLRISKGLSQADLAGKIGRSLSWIKMVETGKRKIQPQDHATLLSIFNE